MVSMEIYTFVILLSCFSVSYGVSDTYNNGASCYDCQYAPQGLTKDDRGRWVVNTYSGFHRCALANKDDAYFVNKWLCESERCFIRKDPNGQIFRGCADQWNLPWGIDTSVNCSRQGRSAAIWWFCDGHLCNDGSLESQDHCGSVDDKDKPESTPTRYKSSQYDTPVLNDRSYEDDREVRQVTDPVTETTPREGDPPYSEITPTHPPPYNIETQVEEETVHGIGFYDNTNAGIEYHYDDDEEDEFKAYVDPSFEAENPIIQDNPYQIRKPVLRYTSPNLITRPNHYTYNPYYSNGQTRTFHKARGLDNNLYSTQQSTTYWQNPNRGNDYSKENFWTWYWHSGALQQMNPQQAYWRYLYTRTQPSKPHVRVQPKAIHTLQAHRSQNPHHYHHPTHYAPIGSNVYHSQYTKVPTQKKYDPPSPVTQTLSSSSSSESSSSSSDREDHKIQRQYSGYESFTTSTKPARNKAVFRQKVGAGLAAKYGTNGWKKSNIKLRVTPVEDEEIKKEQDFEGSIDENEFTDYYENLNQKYEAEDIKSDASSLSIANPCSMSCNGGPGTMHPDPTRSDRFIQCGPGSRRGQTCKCCQPYFHTCPQGTTFDMMHKVCNQAGSNHAEDRKYKTIDFY